MKWRLDHEQIEVLDDAMADVIRRKTPGGTRNSCCRVTRAITPEARRATEATPIESPVRYLGQIF